MTAFPIETTLQAPPGTEALMKGVSASAKTAQTIGIEWMDYLKASFEQASAAAERLAKAGNPARAMEIQHAFLTASGEQMTVRAATFRDLYATLAQDMSGPLLTMPVMAKLTMAKRGVAKSFAVRPARPGLPKTA